MDTRLTLLLEAVGKIPATMLDAALEPLTAAARANAREAVEAAMADQPMVMTERLGSLRAMLGLISAVREARPKESTGAQ
jgi:hypothetical protein